MTICIQLAAIPTAARALPDPGAGKARAELVASQPCEAGPHLNSDYGQVLPTPCLYEFQKTRCISTAPRAE